MTPPASRVTTKAERKAANDRLRHVARSPSLGPLRFMGQEFATLTELRAEFPAFAGDDSVRAIRAGCEDVTAVETFCRDRLNEAYAKSKAAAQRSQYAARHALGGLKSKRGMRK